MKERQMSPGSDRWVVNEVNGDTRCGWEWVPAIFIHCRLILCILKNAHPFRISTNEPTSVGGSAFNLFSDNNLSAGISSPECWSERVSQINSEVIPLTWVNVIDDVLFECLKGHSGCTADAGHIPTDIHRGRLLANERFLSDYMPLFHDYRLWYEEWTIDESVIYISVYKLILHYVQVAII